MAHHYIQIKKTSVPRVLPYQKTNSHASFGSDQGCHDYVEHQLRALECWSGDVSRSWVATVKDTLIR